MIISKKHQEKIKKWVFVTDDKSKKMNVAMIKKPSVFKESSI